MKNFLKPISFLIGLSLIVSCTSTKKIQKNMNSESYSMAYIMDSQIADSKNNITVGLDNINFNLSTFNDSTKIHREKGWFLPLILVYVWNSHNKCIQGKSMIEEDIPSFLKKSLVSEINRSGNFLADTMDNSEYKIELSIDDIKTEGPYVSSGFFYFALYVYGYSYSDIAGPAISNLSISYKLKKNDVVVHTNSFSSEKITEQINKIYTNTSILQQDYAISMVEATSYNFKNVIELVVADLNSFFINQDYNLLVQQEE